MHTSNTVLWLSMSPQGLGNNYIDQSMAVVEEKEKKKRRILKRIKCGELIPVKESIIQ